MRFAMRLLCASLLLASGLLAQARDQREATIGMRAYIDQVVLEGSELVPAPTTNKSPFVVRILKTWPHGEHLRYDFEWVGFEEETYNLVQFLARKDGSSTDGLPKVEVEVNGLLPVEANEPSDLMPAEAPRLHGYSKLQIVVGVLWGVGLLAILFVGRKWKRKAAPPPPKPTLADRMRPLVEHVASGNADETQKAELERMLIAFWRVKLELGDVRAVDAIMTIRKHEEAGVLLRQVEAWLHAPEPPKAMDVEALLEPYRKVTAESLMPEGNTMAGLAARARTAGSSDDGGEH